MAQISTARAVKTEVSWQDSPSWRRNTASSWSNIKHPRWEVHPNSMQKVDFCMGYIYMYTLYIYIYIYMDYMGDIWVIYGSQPCRSKKIVHFITSSYILSFDHEKSSLNPTKTGFHQEFRHWELISPGFSESWDLSDGSSFLTVDQCTVGSANDNECFVHQQWEVTSRYKRNYHEYHPVI